VQVIHGKTGAFIKCLRRGDDDNTSEAMFNGEMVLIAAQCCLTDTSITDDAIYCKRFIGTDSNDGCIAGKAPAPLERFTYSANAAKCASLSTWSRPLALCQRACGGKGCGYNFNPVFTSLPCPLPPPSPPPPSPPPPSPPPPKNRIVGGKPVSYPRQFQFQVSLQHANGFHYCGGALISSEWVVTAAHCTQGSVALVRIGVGLVRESDTDECVQTRTVSEKINYPGYRISSGIPDADISLLKLSAPVDYKSIALISDPSLESANTLLTVTGWGALSQGGATSNVLQKVVVPVVPDAVCNTSYRGKITANMLCAGYMVEGGKDACQGDSGGPIFYKPPTGPPQLVGLVSWGSGCAVSGFPGVYTRVSRFTAWLCSVAGIGCTLVSPFLPPSPSSPPKPLAPPSSPPPLPPPSSPSPLPPPPKFPSGGVCFDSCYYFDDQDCDDGGDGSEYDWCTFGTDCTDCGVRTQTSPPSPPPPTPPAPPSAPPHPPVVPPSGFIVRCVVPSKRTPVPVTPKLAPLGSSGRIVGGVPVFYPRQFQFQASLQYSNGYPFCGGALISSDWVITAAHCVPQQGSVGQVAIGMHRISTAASDDCVQTRTVIRRVVHPDYDSGTLDSDIALLQLSEAVDYGPIALHTDSSFESAGTSVTVSGWGDTSEGGSPPDVLMHVGVPVVADEVCNTMYSGGITANMICAGITEGGKDSCQGDSGGPLFHQPQTGPPQLVGVVSWGRGCAQANFPGVYTRVSKFAEWICRRTGVGCAGGAVLAYPWPPVTPPSPPPRPLEAGSWTALQQSQLEKEVNEEPEPFLARCMESCHGQAACVGFSDTQCPASGAGSRCCSLHTASDANDFFVIETSYYAVNIPAYLANSPSHLLRAVQAPVAIRTGKAKDTDEEAARADEAEAASSRNADKRESEKLAIDRGGSVGDAPRNTRVRVSIAALVGSSAALVVIGSLLGCATAMRCRPGRNRVEMKKMAQP
jgi:trypsin